MQHSDITIQELEGLLINCYSKDMCYPKVREEWSENNKSWGMCAITALIIDDYYDTEFGKIKVDGVSHYFNIKEGKIIDLTAKQFKQKLNYSNYEYVDRNRIISNQDTKMRYEKLKECIEKKLS